MSNIDEPLICPARVTLDASQKAFLDELPSSAPALQAELGCELEPGHQGSHAALAQQVDDTMWWVHWTLTASEINTYTWCSAQKPPSEEIPDDDRCVLYAGHPGRHTTSKDYWVTDEAA
ncbi:MAG TPA: hypothetical protein VGB74_02595 [Actinoplanes sp.]|jgi:hypothetical protein